MKRWRTRRDDGRRATRPFWLRIALVLLVVQGLALGLVVFGSERLIASRLEALARRSLEASAAAAAAGLAPALVTGNRAQAEALVREVILEGDLGLVQRARVRDRTGRLFVSLERGRAIPGPQAPAPTPRARSGSRAPKPIVTPIRTGGRLVGVLEIEGGQAPFAKALERLRAQHALLLSGGALASLLIVVLAVRPAARRIERLGLLAESLGHGEGAGPRPGQGAEAPGSVEDGGPREGGAGPCTPRAEDSPPPADPEGPPRGGPAPATPGVAAEPPAPSGTPPASSFPPAPTGAGAGEPPAGAVRPEHRRAGRDELDVLEEVLREMAARIERRTAELAASEARFRGLVESTADWLWEVDEQGRYTYASPQVESILGYRPEELLGRPAVETMLEEDRERARELFATRRREPGTVGPEVFRRRHRDDHVVDLETSGVPILDGEGRVRGFRGIARDVTERLRLEARMQAQERQLLLADKLRSLGTLVAGVAHEINNPVNYLRMNVELLGRIWRDLDRVLDVLGEREPETRPGGLPIDTLRRDLPQLLEDLRGGVERIAGIVAELRRYGQPESVSEMGTVPLEGCIRSALELLRPVLTPGRVRVEVELEPGLPAVRADPLRLEQAIVNLVSNALEASSERGPGGGEEDCGPARRRASGKEPPPRVRIRAFAEPGEGRVCLLIEDTGPGIAPGDRERMFDPFFTTKSATGGMGLGLPTSARILAEMGGTIEVEAAAWEGSGRGEEGEAGTPRQGAAVRVRLPVYGAHEPG